jgi:hypothetical protein
LLDDKVPDIKGTIGTPAEMDEAAAGHWVDKAMLYEKSWETLRDFGKVGCAINLFLIMWIQGRLDGGGR